MTLPNSSSYRFRILDPRNSRAAGVGLHLFPDDNVDIIDDRGRRLRHREVQNHGSLHHHDVHDDDGESRGGGGVDREQLIGLSDAFPPFLAMRYLPVRLSLGIDSSIGIDSLKGIDSSHGIDSCTSSFFVDTVAGARRHCHNKVLHSSVILLTNKV